MKSLVFDSGPVISLTLNNLLWTLKSLRKHFGGSFIIPEGVKYELVDSPLLSRKFKLEALQVLREIYTGTFDLVKSENIRYLSHRIMNIANHTFKAYDSDIAIVHIGEMDVLAAAKILKSKAVVIDERTTRQLIEDPLSIAKHLQSKLHTHITVDENNIRLLKRELSGIKVIRSVELMSLAYEFHILDSLIIPQEQRVYKNLNSTLLDAVLWSLKLNGCAVSDEEINKLVSLELKKRR